ncbi:unnamed protein product, partial [Iphiclides podalirius]
MQNSTLRSVANEQWGRGALGSDNERSRGLAHGKRHGRSPHFGGGPANYPSRRYIMLKPQYVPSMARDLSGAHPPRRGSRPDRGKKTAPPALDHTGPHAGPRFVPAMLYWSGHMTGASAPLNGKGKFINCGSVALSARRSHAEIKGAAACDRAAPKLARPVTLEMTKVVGHLRNGACKYSPIHHLDVASPRRTRRSC